MMRKYIDLINALFENSEEELVRMFEILKSEKARKVYDLFNLYVSLTDNFTQPLSEYNFDDLNNILENIDAMQKSIKEIDNIPQAKKLINDLYDYFEGSKRQFPLFKTLNK